MKKLTKFRILLLIVCFTAALISLYDRPFKALAVEAPAGELQKFSCNASISDNFSDDGLIVVLNEISSRFRGISKKISQSLNRVVEIKSVEDLTMLPEKDVNSDGSLNAKNSPCLAEYYKAASFRQILHIILREPGKQNVLNAIDLIEDLDGVMYAGPDMLESIQSSIPDDPRLSEQWNINEINGIDALNAWGITTGSINIKVGVIDSGIVCHNDLIGNLAEGWDFVNDNAVTTDDTNGHGTKAAGIIGAVGNNKMGISGVAQNVMLVPLQTINSSGLHSSADRLKAINYAKNLWGSEQQISVLNHSIGGYGTSIEILSAIENFPGLFVWSAGNDKRNVDNLTNISRFNLPNLISVGAIDKNGNRSIWNNSYASNYGSCVNVFAPGGGDSKINDENILTTANDGGYSYFNGTSAAAPHVAGTAALMLAANPSLTGAQLKTLIMSHADTITISTPAGNQNVKKLNAYEAIKSAAFVTDDAGGKITGLNYIPKGDFNIPSSINGITVTEIGADVFKNCTALTAISIPASIVKISTTAFTGCNGINAISVSAANAAYKSGGNCLIQKSNNTLIFGCKNSVIPSGVTKIGEQAFRDCIDLRSVNIPSGVTEIKGHAFEGCSGLVSITLPNSLVYIYWDVFSGCTSLTKLTIPAGVTDIGDNAVVNCRSLANITVDANNTVYKSEDNCLIRRSDNVLLFGCKNSIIPQYVTGIYDHAFDGCIELAQIEIPASVLQIGDHAFYGCGLTAVAFEGESGLTTLGSHAFARCENLVSAVLPSKVTNVSNNVFMGCVKMTNFAFEANGELKTIPFGMFEQCDSLKEIVLPLSVTTIDDWAFALCGNLENIVLSGNVTNIGKYAFFNCGRLTSVTLPKNVTAIGTNAFAGCIGLTIYAQAGGTPSGWMNNWNYSNRAVFWGCQIAADKTYVISFTKSATSISNGDARYGISAPYRYRYSFNGWYTEADFKGISYSPIEILEGGNQTYYARWTSPSAVVTFDLNGGTGDYPPLTISNGAAVSKPTVNPYKKNCKFEYRSLSTDLTRVYNWNALDGSITLVAVWKFDSVISYWNSSAADAFAGGEGNQSCPYQIDSGEQLALMAAEVKANGAYPPGMFANDIYLNNMAEWGR